MLDSYMKKKRAELLPWVKDWSDPQNQLRHSNNIKDMAFWDWYYCHPSSYKLQYWGINILLIVFFTIPILWFISLKWYYFAWLPALFVVLAIIDLVRKYINRHQVGDTTFYDLHFREYLPKK